MNEVDWVLDRERDLAFDFATELHIFDLDELDGPTFYAHAWRLAVHGHGAVNGYFRARIRDSEGEPIPRANQRIEGGVVDVQPGEVALAPPVWKE
jgi:hypothetical protein